MEALGCGKDLLHRLRIKFPVPEVNPYVLVGDFPDDAAGVAGGYAHRRDILRHDAPGADDGVLPDGDAGEDDAAAPIQQPSSIVTGMPYS